MQGSFAWLRVCLYVVAAGSLCAEIYKFDKS